MSSRYGNSDPLLTRLSLDRRNAADGYIQEFAAPTIMTGNKPNGEYWEFDEGNNFQQPNNEKAANGVSRQIHFNAAIKTFSTNAYGSRAAYDQKELDIFAQGGGSGADLRRLKMNMVTDADLLAHEVRVTTLVTTAASYAAANKRTLTGGAGLLFWSDPASPLFADVNTGKDAVIKGDAAKANSMIVSHDIHSNIMIHPEVAARISDNESTGFSDITQAKIGNLFGLDYRVAEAQFNANAEGLAFNPSYAWGNFALIFHRAPAPGKEQISLAYNFAYKDFRMRSYFDEPSQNTFVDNDHDVDTELVAPSVGYLITNAIAP